MSVLTVLQKFVPGATQDDVDIYIDLFADAAPCLSGYTQPIQDLTIALAMAHMMTMSSGGQVTSERTRTGASASYSVWTGKGIESTQFGQQLNALPSGSCVIGLFSKPQRFIKSINPCG